MRPRLILDWGNLACVWECLEHEGLSPATLAELAIPLKGRILLCGAGAGLLVAHLTLQGFDVVGIDSSHGMVARAGARGIAVRHADMLTLDDPDSSYQSIIVSTGVINRLNLRTDFCSRLMDACRRLLKPDGLLHVCFFVEDLRLTAFLRRLGLSRKPSNHRLMAQCASLDELRLALLSDGHLSQSAVEAAFRDDEDLLRDQHRMISDVRRRLEVLGLEYGGFIEEHFGYELHDLTPSDVQFLARVVSSRFSPPSRRVASGRVGCLSL